MHSYTVAIELHTRGMLRVSDMMAVMADRRNSLHHRLLSLPSAEELGDIAQTYDPCRLAMLIYSYLVIFPLPRCRSPLAQLAEMLGQVLIRDGMCGVVRNDTNGLPSEFLFWILLLGGIAAPGGSKIRRWFTATLAGLSVAARISCWEELKEIVKSILWVGCVGDRDGEVVWNEASWL
jgi:hypothetical protein